MAPGLGLEWSSVSAGEAHTCGTTTSGDGYCWGSGGGGSGGLGDPASDVSLVPQAVTGGHTFKSVTAGRSYSCGITVSPDDLMYCWGNTEDPSLGAVPALLTPAIRFGFVSTGTGYACGIELVTDQGYCWGFDNFYGNLGDGLRAGSVSPVAVLGAGLLMIDAGNEHTCGATINTQGFCWGKNNEGQIGDGNVLTTFPEAQPTPAQVLNHDFTWVSSGSRSHSCGITSPGTEVFCWGANSFGELGDGTTADSPVPVFAIDLVP